jgi:hypothetical protein
MYMKDSIESQRLPQAMYNQSKIGYKIAKQSAASQEDHPCGVMSRSMSDTSNQINVSERKT